MDFEYNAQKTVQAAALSLKLHNQPLEYMKLIKLLYLADRTALDIIGKTITGDKYISMDRGPVLSKVCDLISHGPEYDKDNPWFKYISPPQGYCIELLSDPGVDELCEDEEKIINDVYKNYGHINVWKLSKLTHSLFPEWKNPYGSALPIFVKDILKALNKSNTEIDDIISDIEKENALNELFIN